MPVIASLWRFDELIDQIAVFPNAGLLIRPGVRQRLVPRFPYFVVYTTDPTNRVVVAVAHTSRLAEYWIERWEVREPIYCLRKSLAA